MKITGYEIYPVPPREMFLKIETDEGIIGWGEPVLEGRVDPTYACVKELMEEIKSLQSELLNKDKEMLN